MSMASLNGRWPCYSAATQIGVSLTSSHLQAAQLPPRDISHAKSPVQWLHEELLVPSDLLGAEGHPRILTERIQTSLPQFCTERTRRLFFPGRHQECSLKMLLRCFVLITNHRFESMFLTRRLQCLCFRTHHISDLCWYTSRRMACPHRIWSFWFCTSVRLVISPTSSH